jgi:adenylate cyclase
LSASVPPTRDNEEFWRDFLTNGDPRERVARRVLGFIPRGPRCSMCLAPFAGPGAPVMRMIGKSRAWQNPHICASCFTFMAKNHGGAEVDSAFMFADVRGSTTLAEAMPAAEYRKLMDRFYDVASNSIYEQDGILGGFVGDEAIGTWVPGIGGDRYVSKAVDAARAILRATGHEDRDGPWLPIGAGVHAGRAWIGAVGEGSHDAMTAIGDTVNTTARLASVAAAGEILISSDAAATVALDPTLERRQLELKGKQAPIDVLTVKVGPARPDPTPSA